jgi:2-polyprenyl-6-methoxyphenol hydroxylase-like FAD-dependent oxidoreductase
VVLAGDAAYVARPHVGAGVTKAALDAMGLADAIASHPNDLAGALAAYETERSKFGRWCVARGQLMGARIRRRDPGAIAPAQSDIDANAIKSVDEYIETARLIERMTSRS